MSNPFQRLRSYFRRRRTLLLLPAALLAFTGGAYAYFTIGGSSTTTTSAVGSASSLTVSFGTPVGTMFPGIGAATIPVTVTNPGGGVQALSGVSASVNTDGSGNITANGTAVPGCLATWFSASVTAPSTPVSLTPSGTWLGTATVSMTNASVNQNACQGKTPDITVSVS